RVTDHLNLLTQLINELKEEFDTTTSAIPIAKQNVIHPTVISPRHLREELSKVKINSNLEFPFEPENLDNAYKYHDICALSVIYANKILIFAIHVPLVTKEVYQMYNLIPLPILYSEAKDLTNCIEVPPKTYICKNMITHVTKERPTCKLKLKTEQLTTIPEICDAKVVKSDLEI
ncbi:hypothetical protein HUJ05_002190, partial [Dendroctonus ponderosae]